MRTIYYKKILTYSFVFSLLISCAQPNRYIISDDRVIEYREPLDPIGNLAVKFTNNGGTPPSYKQIFISWLAEHKNLENNLGKSDLEVVNAHRNLQRMLGNMQTFLKEQQQQKIQAYQRLYDTLLSAVRKRTSLRVLTTRYRSLRNKITKEFSPESLSNN